MHPVNFRLMEFEAVLLDKGFELLHLALYLPLRVAKEDKIVKVAHIAFALHTFCGVSVELHQTDVSCLLAWTYSQRYASSCIAELLKGLEKGINKLFVLEKTFQILTEQFVGYAQMGQQPLQEAFPQEDR